MRILQYARHMTSVVNLICRISSAVCKTSTAQATGASLSQDDGSHVSLGHGPNAICAATSLAIPPCTSNPPANCQSLANPLFPPHEAIAIRPYRCHVRRFLLGDSRRSHNYTSSMGALNTPHGSPCPHDDWVPIADLYPTTCSTRTRSSTAHKCLETVF